MSKLNKASVIAAVAFVAASFGSANAERDVRDTVHDARGNVVMSIGGCVRTKWESNSDDCGIGRRERTVYFDFNRSSLNSTEKAKLDSLIRAIKDSKRVVNVDVVGFADRIGSSDYNKRLSEKRARTVRDYLSRSGISTRAIRVEGLGETGSKTQCTDTMPQAELVACLAEDRRVEIMLNMAK